MDFSICTNIVCTRALIVSNHLICDNLHPSPIPRCISHTFLLLEDLPERHWRMVSVLKHIDNLLSSRESTQDIGSVDEWTSCDSSANIDHVSSQLTIVSVSVLGLLVTSLNSTNPTIYPRNLKRVLNRVPVMILCFVFSHSVRRRQKAPLVPFPESLSSYSPLIFPLAHILLVPAFMTYPNVRQVQVIRRVHSIDSSLETLGETFSENNVRRRMQDQLKAHAARPLFSGSSVSFVTPAVVFL